MIVVICGVLAAFAFLLLIKVLWSKTQPKLSTNVVVIASGVLVASLLMLAASGRLHWLAAVGTAIVPYLRRVFGLLRFAPFASSLYRQFGGGGYSPFGQTFGGASNDSSTSGQSHSETSTEEISMQLDHTTGEMSGTVLTGNYANRSLESLSESEILDLYHSVEDDSQRLLGAYIHRYHPNLSAERETHSSDQSVNDDPEKITVERACKILGVKESATKEEIVEAHRRLMQRNHPDRGGSEYIAAEINQAKQVLLDRLG